MERILCDTSTVSALLRDAHRQHLANHGAAVKLISIVTAAELRAGAVIANWGARRRTDLERSIKAFPQVPIDEETTFRWAELRGSCRKAGVAVGDNDLWIAATAVRHGMPVASLDDDFARIPGLELIDASGAVRST